MRYCNARVGVCSYKTPYLGNDCQYDEDCDATAATRGPAPSYTGRGWPPMTCYEAAYTNCKGMPFKVSMKFGKHDRNVSGRNRSIRLKTGPRWRGISIWGGGGVSLGWGAGGHERDQGGGARRAQKRGER